MRNGRRDPTPAEWAGIFRRKAVSAFRVAAASAHDHPNSAANRAYYAVLNAIQMRHGPVPPLPKDHGRVGSPEVLARVGLAPQDAPTIGELYRWRRMADYTEDDIYERTARRCVQRAAGILARMGLEVGFRP